MDVLVKEKKARADGKDQQETKMSTPGAQVLQISAEGGEDAEEAAMHHAMADGSSINDHQMQAEKAALMVRDAAHVMLSKPHGKVVDWSHGNVVDWSHGKLVDWSHGKLVDWSFGTIRRFARGL
jgi:hypothetical protein